MVLNAKTELDLIGVSKYFGGVCAISDVNIGFDKGQVTCIIGPNGAGKTTLFNLICGMSRPDRGEIRFQGRRLNDVSPQRTALLGIGRLFQDVRIFEKMTVIENVCVARKSQPGEKVFAAFLWPLIGGHVENMNLRKAADFVEFVGLSSVADQPAEHISYGQQKLMAIARLLNNEADCLLLDEPTAGVNPDMLKKLLDIIRALASGGRTVIIIEHNLGIVQEIGDWVYLMDQGRIEAFGTPREVLRESSLERFFS